MDTTSTHSGAHGTLTNYISCGTLRFVACKYAHTYSSPNCGGRQATYRCTDRDTQGPHWVLMIRCTDCIRDWFHLLDLGTWQLTVWELVLASDTLQYACKSAVQSVDTRLQLGFEFTALVASSRSDLQLQYTVKWHARHKLHLLR